MPENESKDNRVKAEGVIIDRVANGFFLRVSYRGGMMFFIAKDAEEAADFVAAFDWHVPVPFVVPAPPTTPAPAPDTKRASVALLAPSNGEMSASAPVTLASDPKQVVGKGGARS